VHAELEPLAFLLGAWHGEGRGDYPTIDAFFYEEELEFTENGEPYLVYAQRSWAPGDGTPIHLERGFWRPAGEGRLDVALAHPLGLTELSEGTVSGGVIELRSTFVARAVHGLAVTRYDRRYEVDGDVMLYEQRLGTIEVPLAYHVSARLMRIGAG
jgi:hypothetical protein